MFIPDYFIIVVKYSEPYHALQRAPQNRPLNENDHTNIGLRMCGMRFHSVGGVY